MLFEEVKDRKALIATDTLRELQCVLFAFYAYALTVKADDVICVHHLSVPDLLVYGAEIFVWQQMIAGVAEDVGVVVCLQACQSCAFSETLEFPFFPHFVMTRKATQVCARFLDDVCPNFIRLQV